MNQEYGEYMLDEWFFEMKKQRKDDLQVISRSISAWKQEKDIEQFVEQAKKRFAEQSIALIETKLQELRVLYKKYSTKDNAWAFPMIVNLAHELQKRKKRYEISLLPKSTVETILTRENIDRANEKLIQEIVEIGRNGRAKCVFHGGEDFNMGIKENIAHCFVCGKSGDAISVYMAVTGKSFPQSVRDLM